MMPIEWFHALKKWINKSHISPQEVFALNCFTADKQEFPEGHSTLPELEPSC